MGLAVRDLTARPFSAEELTAVAEQMDGYCVHLLSFALYTHHRDPRRKLTEAIIFGRSKTIQQVMLETGDLADLEKYPDRELRTEIWQRGQPPKILHRLFARSTDSARKKEELIGEVSSGKRQLQPHVTALICGETSCTRMDRKLGMTDDFGILPQLKKHSTRLIVSNNHSAFRRYECRERCNFLSEDSRWVVTCWNTNANSRSDFRIPWWVFHGGDAVTVTRIERPGDLRADLQLGYVDTFKLTD